MSDNRTKFFTKGKVIVLGVLVVCAAIAIAALNPTAKSGSAAENQPSFEVKKGNLTIAVTESGTIKAREQVIIKNELEGRTTILYLIPEATHVKEGDLLVELDASELEDQRITQEIDVQNAESSYIGAREGLEVTKNQAQSDIDQAKLDFEFAKLDLEKYLEGEYPNTLKDHEAKIVLADEEVQRTKEKYEWSKTLAKEEYISETELKSDELAWKKAQLELELAQNAKQLLENYTYGRTKTELESNVKQTEMALERVQRKAAADIVQAEAELKAALARFERQKSILEKLETQIAKAKIYAPADGMVVYASSAEFSWRGDDEPLQEGSEVREREELIYLPTANAVNAEINIHETNLNKVSPGLPVTVEIDALPGKTFTGKVTKIAPLPDARFAWMNPDLKVYPTQIELDGDNPELRTGMSCKARILVDRYRDATYVPIQSVVRIGNQPSVYRFQDGQVVPHPVQIGLDNNRMVHILDGLTPGDRVLLAPPLTASAVRDDNETGQPEQQQHKKSEQKAKPDVNTNPIINAASTDSQANAGASK